MEGLEKIAQGLMDEILKDYKSKAPDQRERIATAALQGILRSFIDPRIMEHGDGAKVVAICAIKFADALIDQLNEAHS